MPITPDSFAQHLLDQLQPLGRVTFRPMFGAACLFVDGTAFAIVEDGKLYLKVNDATKPTFRAAGSQAFTYFHKAKNTRVEMSYETVPDDDVDGPALLKWARMAKEAALTKGAKAPTRAQPAAKTASPRTKRAPARTAPTRSAAQRTKPAAQKAPAKTAPTRSAAQRTKPAATAAPKRTATKKNRPAGAKKRR